MISDITEALLRSKRQFRALDEALLDSPGLYGIFATPESLVDTVLEGQDPDRPLCVGKAEGTLRRRLLYEHFAVCKTGWSTVRRSLGAVARAKLALYPAKRGNTGKAIDHQNYAFDTASETLLSEWMTENMSVGWWRYTCSRALSELEAELIGKLQTPVNLTHSQHPLVREVKRLRAECRELAKKSPHVGCS